MIKRLNLADNTLVERVLLIQKLAYRVEADLIGFKDIPALYETLSDIRTSKEIFLGYFVEQILAAVLSYCKDDKTVDIGRLVVHPDYFRRGIGQALVQHVETIADITAITVSTGAANHPARKLYEGLEYQLIQQCILPEGVAIVEYAKLIT